MSPAPSASGKRSDGNAVRQLWSSQKPFLGRKGGTELGPKMPLVDVTVVNGSDQPIYDVELRWHRGFEGWGP